MLKVVVLVILLNDLFYINIKSKRNAQQWIMWRRKVLHMLLEVRRFYLNLNIFRSLKVAHKPSKDSDACRSDEPEATFLAFFRRHIIHFKSNVWSIVQPHWRKIMTNNNVCSLFFMFFLTYFLFTFIPVFIYTFSNQYGMWSIALDSWISQILFRKKERIKIKAKKWRKIACF